MGTRKSNKKFKTSNKRFRRTRSKRQRGGVEKSKENEKYYSRLEIFPIDNQKSSGYCPEH